MAGKMLKLHQTIVENDDDEYTSDEMIYSDEMQSDDEYDDDSCTGNKSKRLQSLQKGTDTQFRNRSKCATNEHRKTGIKRMPTRKPDPKVSNRNAIMARENRRKKKEHMEVLQKTVEDTQIENKKLRKLLSMRNHTIQKLTQESLYLRSILSNKTEIMSLLRCIQGNRTPITSSALSFVTDEPDYRSTKIPTQIVRRSNSGASITTSSGCSPASSSMSPASYHEDDKENDLDIGRRHANEFNATESTASSYEQNVDTDFQWENLLSEPTTFKSDLSPLHITDLRDIDDSEILSTNSSNTVKSEHNYFNNPITTNNNKVAEKCDQAKAMMSAAAAVATNTPGVCLHVSSGRVSLEFCAACHQNSQNAWCEEM